MFRITQVKVGIDEILKTCSREAVKAGIITGEEEGLVREAVCKQLHIKDISAIKEFTIIRRALDARKERDTKYTYTVEFSLPGRNFSEAAMKKMNIIRVSPSRKEGGSCSPAENFRDGAKKSRIAGKKRPVVAGMGPAGLFCAYELAMAGNPPVIIERGAPVEERIQDVKCFWESGILNTESNVQFGEGGAGTFSDGKLNTLVKDKTGRNRRVLETFAAFGAPADILYLQKPHIGTDCLHGVIVRMRKKLLELGCEIHFHTKLLDLYVQAGELHGIAVMENGTRKDMDCETLVLATGHSARDTFFMLYDKAVLMEQKPFAIGVRMEHRQSMIDDNQYGKYSGFLPAADYKLTHRAKSGHGVYSFCMCPGGYVVNASSEEGMLAVNGMSDYGRDGRNANSAIVVTVSQQDFPDASPLAGIGLQRQLERLAYQKGNGCIPVQLYGDFVQGRASTGAGTIIPDIRGSISFANLREVLPSFVSEGILEAMPVFGRRIRGYDREDAVLSGIESRTSSPVRILRDSGLQSSIRGLFPCGEGAGYAGGIMSAAMDGIKVAEMIGSG